MNKNDSKNVDGQEIDLALVSEAFSGLFRSISRSIFRLIRYLLRHIVVFFILVVVGAILGFYLDEDKKTYDSFVTIRPNFRSTDYVYSKIDLLYSRINDNDTLFLKAIGIKNPSNLKEINIYPIVDIYKFISENDSKDSDQNFELFKYLSTDMGDMKDMVLDKVTSKNYTFHQIHFVTSSRARRDEILEPILNYLESNKDFRRAKQVFVENTNLKVEANKNMIAQIDGLLATFTNENSQTAQNTRSVYINQNTQMNDLIQTKNNLVSEIGSRKLELLYNEKVVKEISNIINLVNTKGLSGKLKILVPIAFLLIYLLFIGTISFYKKQAALYKEEKL
jgi:hypothetical protein